MKTANDRDENVAYIKDCIDNDLPKLKEAIKVEAQDKDEASTTIIQTVNGEVKKIQDKDRKSVV